MQYHGYKWNYNTQSSHLMGNWKLIFEVAALRFVYQRAPRLWQFPRYSSRGSFWGFWMRFLSFLYRVGFNNRTSTSFFPVYWIIRENYSRTVQVTPFAQASTRGDRKVSDFSSDIYFFGKDALHANGRYRPRGSEPLTSIGIYERFTYITPHTHSHAIHTHTRTHTHTLTYTHTHTRVHVCRTRFALWLACDPHASKRQNICFWTNWLQAAVV